MKIYINTPTHHPETEMEALQEIEIMNDGCFGTMPTDPDLVVTQGADLEFRFCAETKPDNRPQVACLGKDYITLTQKACITIGDTVELTCFDDCEVLGEEGASQHKVTDITPDGLRLTVEPGFPAITKERCYSQTDLLEGCLDTSAAVAAPRIVILQDKWTLHGIAAHRISNGCIRSMGATVVAGSSKIKTLMIDAVQPDDHISIPSAGVIDATVLNVRRTMVDGLEADVIELNLSLIHI
jgi:hypothetical protein